MKKPKKTLKELVRIEALLSKQTARSAKLLARRKAGEAENPVTSAYYDHIATQQAIALADLSEIVHLSESLSRHVMEADAERAAKKAAKAARMAPAKGAAKPGTAAKPAALSKPAVKPASKRIVKRAPGVAAKPVTPTKPVATKPVATKPAARRPARRAPAKTAGS
jgi:hypothetical protein